MRWASSGVSVYALPHYYTIKVDNTAPFVTLSGVSDGGAYYSDQEAVLTASDVLPEPEPAMTLAAPATPSSGVDHIEWQLEGDSAWTRVAGDSASIGIPASQTGTFTFLYGAVDKAGNVGEAVPFTVSVVAPTAPDVTPPDVSVSGADARWHHGPVTVNLSASDPGVPPVRARLGVAVISFGVKQIDYREEGSGQWITVAGDAAAVTGPARANGSHAFECVAWDNAGLRSALRTFIVRIDSLRPRVRHLPSAAIARGGLARLRYRLADNLSTKLRVRLEVIRSGRVRASYDVGSKPVGTWLAAKLRCSFRPGRYEWRIVATDLAENLVRGSREQLLIRPR